MANLVKRHLLLDSRVVERVEGGELALGTVTKDPGNPLFGEEHPWEARFDHMYPNALYDRPARLYRLWYTTFLTDPATTETPPQEHLIHERGAYGRVEHGYRDAGRPRRLGLCYAESDDGLEWRKPALGLVDFEGSARNNIIRRGLHGAGVFRDDDGPAEGGPFRMVTKMHVADEGGMDAALPADDMGVASSQDGVRWTDLVATPAMATNGDTHNNALWAPTLGRYVAYGRRAYHHPDLPLAIRQVARTESADFTNWSAAEVVLEGSHPGDQVYSMPVFHYSGIYLGLPAIFDGSVDGSRQSWTELAWSPDTVTWHRVCPGQPLIPNSDTREEYDWGEAYASRPVFLDDEIRLYYGACNRDHSNWKEGFLCLARLRPDGFAGYRPTAADHPATVVSAQIPCAGTELRLTADVTAGGSVCACLEGAEGLLATSTPVSATVTDGLVVWAEGADLAPLIGRPVRLRFELRAATLYSFGFTDGTAPGD